MGSLRFRKTVSNPERALRKARHGRSLEKLKAGKKMGFQEMAMDFSLPDKIREFLETVRLFVREQLYPIADQVDREDEIPSSVIKKMRELGLFGLTIPEKYGGLGLTVLESCLVIEELGKGGLAFVRLVGGGDLDIAESGTEEQKDRYLPRLATGEMIGATTMTEDEAGSDAANIKTSAVAMNGGYLLNGTKIMISRADISDLFCVTAVTDPKAKGQGRITRFLVEKKSSGLNVGKPDPKLGLNGIHTCQVVLSDCLVPREHILGELGRGLSGMLKFLNLARLRIVAAAAVGNAQRLLELSIGHAQKRVQFGKPIGYQQGIQWMLADMATEIHASRMMVYHAAWQADQGTEISREAAMVKLFAGEMACRVADRALQIHGGMGYMKAGPVERLFRDNRLGRIIDGTSEVQRLIIARDLLKKGA
jgi:acyl-CoA dehydrogenase